MARYEGRVLRFELPPGRLRLGSAPDNDLCIPFPGISRRHAQIERTERGALIRDLGSKNLLVVNGATVTMVELPLDATLRIGHATLSFEEAQTADLQIAIEVAETATSSPSDETGTEHHSSTGGPAAALQLVRNYEGMSHRLFLRTLSTRLDEAREVLSAETMALGNWAEDGRISIRSIAGSLPDEEALKRIVPGRRRRQITRRQSDNVIESVHGRRWCMAVFGPDQRPAQWQLDFIEYLACKSFGPESEPAAASLDAPLPVPDSMVIGSSARMRAAMDQLRATAGSDLDVLLTGETGTGKELFARLVHAAGKNASGAFVAINCAAIPSELLEAELFGVHGRVATGVDPRPGRFAQAEGGSLFLDEIGELPDRLQAKLLRVLQEREILPLGAVNPRPIHLRVIAASNRNLLQLSRNGTFRSDLYYRLSALRFDLPSLRDRREDIPGLTLTFANEAAARHHKNVRGISRSALAALIDYDWPGNIRELRNQVQRAMLICEPNGVLDASHFELEPPPNPPPDAPDAVLVQSPPAEPLAPLQLQVESLERGAISRALVQCNGNRSAAARLLGITRNGLSLKLRRLGLS
ncbi:MAG TPA: sigma 54-interacting transcriptional regulator [Thermoanaerobaculia bacterium]|nr:sigma 54-interacting transcriptional regulator [Thermoanaerobaculia bacterium]